MGAKCHCYLIAQYIMLCTIHSQHFHSVILLKAGVMAFTDLFYTLGHYKTTPYP